MGNNLNYFQKYNKIAENVFPVENYFPFVFLQIFFPDAE
jgi:hypothetical protein